MDVDFDQFLLFFFSIFWNYFKHFFLVLLIILPFKVVNICARVTIMITCQPSQVEINFEDKIKVLILMSSLPEFWDIVINEIQSNAISNSQW